MTFIVQVIEALAWPILLGFIIWYGRNHIGVLFERVENLEGGGVKAAFRKQLDKAENNLSNPALPKPIPSPPILPPVEAELPPAYLIQQAWTAVRDAIRNAAKEKGLDKRRNFRVANTVDLAKLLGLPQYQIVALRDLSRLRNVTVRGDEAAVKSLTDFDALRYRNIAETLIRSIKNKPFDPDPL